MSCAELAGCDGAREFLDGFPPIRLGVGLMIPGQISDMLHGMKTVIKMEPTFGYAEFKQYVSGIPYDFKIDDWICEIP